jgi:DMSO/TMAO reductase YedYZ heme-binding membrane subunit
MSQIPWYAARASGVVSWALILLTIVWGMLLATRVLGRRAAPAWLLSLHRYLGALACVFVGVHVVGILLDSYTSFGLADVLVPFASSWHPLAVAWGIVGMYLLAAIEVTSLLRHKLSNKMWHSIHLLSYLLFGAVTVHFVTAGTDAKAILASTAAVLVATAAAFGSAALYLWRSDPGVPDAAPKANPRIPAAARKAATPRAAAPAAPARSLDEPMTGRLVTTGSAPGPAPVSSAGGRVAAPRRTAR